MSIQFHSVPLRTEKALTIQKFESRVTSLRVIETNGIIVGTTLRGLERGRFRCNRFYQKHEQVDLYEFKDLLECLVKIGYITEEEQRAELDWLLRYQQLQRVAQNKREVIHLFTNPEFIKYLKTARDKLPEWLTLPKGSDKEFALALMKLKEIVDAQEIGETKC